MIDQHYPAGQYSTLCLYWSGSYRSDLHSEQIACALTGNDFPPASFSPRNVSTVAGFGAYHDCTKILTNEHVH